MQSTLHIVSMQAHYNDEMFKDENEAWEYNPIKTGKVISLRFDAWNERYISSLKLHTIIEIKGFSLATFL